VELAQILVWYLPRLGVPASVDGTVLRFLGTTQEVTPNCLGLAGFAAYAAAVLATPAAWGRRARGFGLGLALIIAIIAARFFVFAALLNISAGAFRFTHVATWGAVAPIVLLGIWGSWAVRELRLLPAFPLRFLSRVALVFPLLLAGWYYSLDRYLVALITVANSALTGIGVPVRSVSLVQVDVYRYFNVALGEGGFRIELAAGSVTLVAFLSLVVASPAPLARRAGVALSGVAALFALQALGAAGIVFLGWTAPSVVLPGEVFNDFLNLVAPVVLWLYLLGDRLRGASPSRTPSASRSRPMRSPEPGGTAV
jgi:exosortase/archaeosortase